MFGSLQPDQKGPPMSSTMYPETYPETDRFPLDPATTHTPGARIRPFGLSVARWDPLARFDGDQVSVDPNTQIGMVGDQPLHEVITAGTTCQVNSDGKDVITLDYPVDDK